VNRGSKGEVNIAVSFAWPSRNYTIYLLNLAHTLTMFSYLPLHIQTKT